MLRSLRTFRWREAVPRMIADFLIVHFSMIAALAMSVVYQTGLGNAVAAHAIVMGTVLAANDMRVEQHDLTELPLGFLDDPAIAVGLTASRPIAGGAFLTNQQLVAAKAVQRGQSVTLIADAGGMSVRMAGKALNDGLINQRVKVQNLSSGKIVEGIARSEQVVEIIF